MSFRLDSSDVTYGLPAGEMLQYSRFYGFVGFDVDRFADPDSWRGAEIAVEITSNLPDEFKSAAWLDDLREGPFTDGSRWDDDPENDAAENSEIIDLPCRVTMSLMFNGRMIAAGASSLKMGTGQRKFVGAGFTGITIDPDVLPRFGKGPAKPLLTGQESDDE